MKQAKPFGITKRQVWEVYKRVKAKKGAAGVDSQTIQDFEENLEDNLYKLWNRLASGSYFPPPVLRVEIPKGDGRMRPLGIPTVSDRIAQMVVKTHLEPDLEKHFHADSYGYRPGKSALDAGQGWRVNGVGKATGCLISTSRAFSIISIRQADDAGGARAYGREMGAPVYRTVARGPD